MTTEHPLIDQVARAILDQTDLLYKVSFDELMHSSQESLSKKARAAIAAILDGLREPTDEMHHAARDWSYDKYGKPIGSDASDGCWKAMIDAAKKEIGV